MNLKLIRIMCVYIHRYIYVQLHIYTWICDLRLPQRLSIAEVPHPPVLGGRCALGDAAVWGFAFGVRDGLGLGT